MQAGTTGCGPNSVYVDARKANQALSVSFTPSHRQVSQSEPHNEPHNFDFMSLSDVTQRTWFYWPVRSPCTGVCQVNLHYASGAPASGLTPSGCRLKQTSLDNTVDYAYHASFLQGCTQKRLFCLPLSPSFCSGKQVFQPLYSPTAFLSVKNHCANMYVSISS